MNLVFYSPQTLPSIGGLQYVVHYWAEAMSARGHQIAIITDTTRSPAFPLKGEGAAPSSGEGVVSVRSLRRASFFQQLRAMRAADKVIMFNVSLKGLPAVLLSGKPLYISHHTGLWYDNGPRPLRQRLKQWVANHIAKKNCACSAYIASLYKHCRVIHSPYRHDIFVPGNGERKPGSILFAGRLVSDKGADLLLQACCILKKEGFTFSLTIVGDGPEREKLEQLALELGLCAETGIPRCVETRTGAAGSGDVAVNGKGNKACVDHQSSLNDKTELTNSGKNASQGAPLSPWRGAGGEVTFARSLPQPSLARLMQTHQIMVVPSRMEPMGMVVAEGLGCGCRMVVSNQGGMPEVGGSFCRYFENGSVDSLADALKQQLIKPITVDERLLQQHLEKFTIEYSVGELEKWLMG